MSFSSNNDYDYDSPFTFNNNFFPHESIHHFNYNDDQSEYEYDSFDGQDGQDDSDIDEYEIGNSLYV